MAGIYLHIPFCKQACHYCNFHFSTSLKYKEEMVVAILKELDLQKNYLEKEPIETIYFGGGTPSLLSQKEISTIIEKIERLYPIAPNPEITLEANPDDLTLFKLKELTLTAINRLSIGIQSFSDEDLQFMNRAHNSEEAQTCLKNARSLGFDNLTIDLIYGTPTTSHEQWNANLDQTFACQIPHISCYCLTVEPQTALAHFVKVGKVKPINEEQAAQQLEILMQRMKMEGYEHYEISNFAKPGYYSRHNSSYWQGKKYLGVGPSAHSFDGKSRQWNVANNAKYLQTVQAGKLAFEKENLSLDQQYNEYVMTSLRTMWGCDLKKIKELGSTYVKYFEESSAQFIDNEYVVEKEQVFVLTEAGKLLADKITMELFI